MSNTQILDKIINYSLDQERETFSPQEIVNNLLTLIGGRESNVLNLRYGFNTDKALTLDAIGQRMNLTRERVRQIENSAIKSIGKHKNYEEFVTPFRRTVIHLLEKNGGLISYNSLVDQLAQLSNTRQQEICAIKFLLKRCLSGVDEVKDKEFNTGFRLFNLSLDFVKEILQEIYKIFEKQNKILEADDVIHLFKNSEYYQQNRDKFLPLTENASSKIDKIIFSYLDISKQFICTPMNQWGLSIWEKIKPRRVNGKIYLVFLAKKEPMHYQKIAETINQYWENTRPAQPATVHNELIADDRFALVGRGIYALKEWGYESGTVEQIVKDLLKKNSNLTDAEIVGQVRNKKMVKDSTIKQAIKKFRN